MNKLINSNISKQYFKADLKAIDDFILVNGEGGLYKPQTTIKRVFYGSYGEIPQEESEIEQHYITSLNYSDFINDFDIGLFWQTIEQEGNQLAIENEFKKAFIELIDNHQNFKIVPTLLSDIIKYFNRIISELKSIKTSNKIQEEVISYFENVYDRFLSFISERYQTIYPEIFKKDNESLLISEKQQNKDNPHPRIFKDKKAFYLFEKLLKDFNVVNNSHTDFSFIYRKMQYDGFIFKAVGDKEFRDWFNSNYNMWFEKTKTLNNTQKANNSNRLTIYNNTMQSFY